jgi:hypothetical protein
MLRSTPRKATNRERRSPSSRRSCHEAFLARLILVGVPLRSTSTAPPGYGPSARHSGPEPYPAPTRPAAGSGRSDGSHLRAISGPLARPPGVAPGRSGHPSAADQRPAGVPRDGSQADSAGSFPESLHRWTALAEVSSASGPPAIGMASHRARSSQFSLWRASRSSASAPTRRAGSPTPRARQIAGRESTATG